MLVEVWLRAGFHNKLPLIICPRVHFVATNSFGVVYVEAPPLCKLMSVAVGACMCVCVPCILVVRASYSQAHSLTHTLTGGVWKNTEDEILKAAVMKYGEYSNTFLCSLFLSRFWLCIAARTCNEGSSDGCTHFSKQLLCTSVSSALHVADI